MSNNEVRQTQLEIFEEFKKSKTRKDKVKYKEYSSELLKLEGEYHFKIRKFKEYLNNNNVFKDLELQRMIAKEIKKLK